MTQRPIFRPMSYLRAVCRITASLTGNTVPASSLPSCMSASPCLFNTLFLCSKRYLYDNSLAENFGIKRGGLIPRAIWFASERLAREQFALPLKGLSERPS
jgi:hypothetical protein